MFFSPIVTQETPMSGLSFRQLFNIENWISLLHIFQVMRGTHIQIGEKTSDILKARDFKELYNVVL